MKKAKMVDVFTKQIVKLIDMSELPKKNDCITLIENTDMVSYFEVDKIIRGSGEVLIEITPLNKKWAIGFHKMYGRKMHFFFANAEYTSFQNEDVG